MDIEGVLAITFIFGGGTLFLLAISPIGKAVAERIRGKTVTADAGELRAELADHKETLTQELETVRHEIAELAERLDFAERLLAQKREGERLAPPKS
jgi:F0F1-type ATP synthase membrane subunit b/b'